MKQLLFDLIFLKKSNFIRLYHSLALNTKKNQNSKQIVKNYYKYLLSCSPSLISISNRHITDDTTTTKSIKFATVKVIPKKARDKIDYSQTYTANNFLTTVRAFNEYLLNPNDLIGTQQYKRRSPYDEITGQEELITVYLRSDLEKKAILIWGSLENLNKEKEKRKYDIENRRRYLFNLKKTLRTYKNRIEQLENPIVENSFTNTTILKTFSGKVVVTAIAINAFNVLIKLIGWLYTGSASLFAETVHSLADTINQLILAFGLHQSLKKPNQDHPYGYSNMTYITSLISGVGIFCFGTGLSWYHGIMAIIDPAPLESLPWALALLSFSAVSETATLLMASYDIKSNADKIGLGFWQYITQGYKPSINVVLLEDIAAVSGVFIAATCMTLTHITGNHLYDACGSLLIGCVLGSVASFIIYTNTVALVGRSIPQKKITNISGDIESDIMIRSIYDIKATDLGGQTVMFKAEVDIDGREITRSYLERIDIEKLLEEVQKINNVNELEGFLLKHGENIVDRVGAEIDRIERNLRKKYPDLQHVDLEVL